MLREESYELYFGMGDPFYSFCQSSACEGYPHLLLSVLQSDRYYISKITVSRLISSIC